MKHLALIGIAWLGVAWASPAPGRVWTDCTGAYRVEAELVTVRGGKVYLEKADGSVAGVPLAKLSAEDLRYLRSLPQYREQVPADLGEGRKPGDGGPDSPGREGPVSPKTPGSPGARPALAVIPVDDASKVGEVRRFPDMGWGVESLAFSPDGRFLAAGKMDRAILMFDVVKSQKVAHLEKLENLGQVTAVAFSPDGRRLLSGGYSGRIQVWNVAEGGALTEASRFVGHSREVRGIAVSRDGRRVLSGSGDKTARCWTLADGREQFAIDGFSRTVRATFITRGGKQGLATDGTMVVLIDMAEGKAIQKMSLERGVPQTAAIAPDGSCVVINDTYALKAWEIRTGKGYPLFQDNESQWYATFLPNSRYFLSGGRGKVSLWEMSTQRKLYEFDTAGTSYVQSIAASPDGRHFAAIPGSAGQALQVFRMPADVAGD